jgi:hypothetical protein
MPKGAVPKGAGAEIKQTSSLWHLFAAAPPKHIGPGTFLAGAPFSNFAPGLALYIPFKR